MLNIMTPCGKRQATTLTTIMTLFSQSLFPARLPALYVSPKSEKRRNPIETKLMWCLKYVYFANSTRWKKRATRLRARKQEVGVGGGGARQKKSPPLPRPGFSRFYPVRSTFGIKIRNTGDCEQSRISPLFPQKLIFFQSLSLGNILEILQMSGPKKSVGC